LLLEGIMRLRRYRGRHLKARPKRHGPIVVATAASVTVATPAARAGSYTVRRGDTLSDVARRHGTSVAALARMNRLSNPNFIVAGRSLRVPTSVGVASVHVVRTGETLSAIAARYGTSVDSLARINRISDPNLIVAGTKLKVPVGSPETTALESAPTSSIEASLENQSATHAVDTSLTKAVAWQESGWQQDVRSKAGAIGVMQVMPDTAKFVNRSLGGGKLNVRRADDNVHLGVMYLRHMLKTMGSKRKALAAYFAGPGNVNRRLTRPQRHYANNVLAIRNRFR
jgi:soluble lytic murein transglycosylase-like protein